MPNWPLFPEIRFGGGESLPCSGSCFGTSTSAGAGGAVSGAGGSVAGGGAGGTGAADGNVDASFGSGRS